MPGLLDGQYGYRGLTFGKDTPYLVKLAEELEGVVVRSGDRELPRGHGSVPGPHYAVARQPVLSLTVSGGTSDMDTLVQTLADTFAPQPTPQPLTWKRPTRGERMVYARPLQFAPPRGVGLRNLKVALTCADPRIYSSAGRSLIVPLYTAAGGGLDYPGDYPKNFPAGVNLDAVASNAGAADAYPLVRVYGPASGTLTGFTLHNLTTGEDLSVAASVAAGQILTVDNSAFVTGSGGLVVGLDGASRYGSWTQPRMPFRLPPGDSLLRFQITGTATSAACVLTWADTWLS
jgi:hypothetical protein